MRVCSPVRVSISDLCIKPPHYSAGQQKSTKYLVPKLGFFFGKMEFEFVLREAENVQKHSFQALPCIF